MRQVMPHRNNIRLQGLQCKKFLSGGKLSRHGATFLQQSKGERFTAGDESRMSNNGLYVL